MEEVVQSEREATAELVEEFQEGEAYSVEVVDMMDWGVVMMDWEEETVATEAQKDSEAWMAMVVIEVASVVKTEEGTMGEEVKEVEEEE